MYVSAIIHLPRTFLPSDFPWDYQIEPIAMEPPGIGFPFPHRILYRSASGMEFEVWEWIRNYTPRIIKDVIIHPCWYQN